MSQEYEDNIVPLPMKRPDDVEGRRAQRQSDKLVKAKARHRVLELAAAGLTDEQIAMATDKTPRGVRQTINRQLEKWAEVNASNLAHYRVQKLFELDQLKRAIWGRALEGDLKATREAMKLIALQAQMSGAGAPAKHEHDHNMHVPIDPDEVRRMERAWMDSAPRQLPLLEDVECDTPDDEDEDVVVDADVVQ